MFVPMPTGWLFHEPMIPGFGAGSNGSSRADQKDNERLQWRRCHRHESETQALRVICSGRGSLITLVLSANRRDQNTHYFCSFCAGGRAWDLCRAESNADAEQIAVHVV